MIVTQALHRLPRWLPRVFLANALMASALFGPVDWATTSSLAEEGGGSRLDTNTPETNYVSVQSAQDAALFGTISGVVFRDYNGNGLQGANDLGIAGVIITATDNSIPAQTVSTVTLNDGSYTLPQLAGTRARVIFSLPPSLSFLRPGMPTVGSSVRFVDISAGNVTGINMSYNNPDEYCQANPLIILNTFRNGTSVGNANAGCVSFAYDVADGSPNDTGGDVPIQYGIPALPGTAANPRVDAQLQQIGSTWGIAHQHMPLRVFLSSFVRRHVGLGPRGEDGVYVIDYSNSAAASVVGGFDVQGVAPRNGGALIDVGTVTRTGSNDYVLGATSMSNVDLDAFDKMGKVSFGDTDIGEDGKTLWMVNLNQRGLIQVDLSNYTPTMANPSFLPTNVISQYLLSPALGEPTCVGGVFRPWALKFKDQRGYLGGVCSGEVSQQITDVVAYVLSFDPQNAGLGFSTVLSVSMNYTRENNMNGLGFLPERWHAWVSTWAQTGLTFPITPTNGPDSGAYGQPILSDIEFTENGSIVLGFSDRFGHQTGYDQYIPMPSADTLYGGFTSVSSGDILQVCRTASGYVMEGGVGCATGEVAGGSRRVDDGPSGSGEFYYQDTYITNGANGNTAPTHDEVTLGGLLWLPGSGQVASTVFDPVDYPVSTSPSNRGLNTVGVHWYNNRTGSKDDGY